MQVTLPLLLMVTVIWSPVWQIYWTNLENLHLPLSHFWEIILVSSISVFAPAWLLLRFSPEKVRTLSHLAIFYIGMSSWLTLNFFVMDYGFLGFMDGQEPDWTSRNIHGLIEIIVLVSLGGLLIYFRRRVMANLVFISWTLIVTAIAFFPTVMHQQSQGKGYTLTDSGLFELSKNQNVLVFVLDTVQADVVQEVLENNIELSRELDGFTFFRNATSAFPKTYASIPTILTGEVFDNSEPLPDFMAKAFKNSLPGFLNSIGFDVRLWSFTPQSIIPLPLLADNVVSTEDRQSTVAVEVKDLHLLVNLSLFRLSPHFLRPLVYNEGSFIWTPENSTSGDCVLDKNNMKHSGVNQTFDSIFIDKFIQCTIATRDEDVFRFFHLTGAHPPLKYGTQYNYLGNQPLERKPFVSQTEGVLNVLVSLFRRLKSLGVYEDAMIVLVSDHGAGAFKSGINYSLHDLPTRLKVKPVNQIYSQVIAGGIPMMLIKFPGANGEIVVSDVPAELSDIPRTVADQLNVAGYNPGGVSLLQEIDPDRTRLHKHYKYTGWDIEFIVPMTEYEINGFSWFPENWRKSGRDFTAEALSNFSGILLPFSGEIAGGEGWSEVKDHGRTIIADRAVISIGKDFDSPQLVSVVHNAYQEKELAEVEVLLGSESVVVWQFYPDDRQRKKAIVLRAGQAKKLSSEKLYFIPKSVGVGNNKVRFRSLRVTDLSAYNYRLGSDAFFGEGDTGNRYKTYGWFQPKDNESRSLGHSSGLLVKLDESIGGELLLEMELTPIIFDQYPLQTVNLLANGVLMNEVTLTEAGIVTAKIPDKIYSDGHYLEIILEYQNPIRPSAINPKWPSQIRAISITNFRLSGTETSSPGV